MKHEYFEIVLFNYRVLTTMSMLTGTRNMYPVLERFWVQLWYGMGMGWVQHWYDSSTGDGYIAVTFVGMPGHKCKAIGSYHKG